MKLPDPTSPLLERLAQQPDLRKQHGAYYTPRRVVDYLVEKTLGKLLKERRLISCEKGAPRLDPPLRVLDPACGGGAFLIGAYQFLMDWHLQWYTHHHVREWAGTRIEEREERWELTFDERKRILTEHIFGVDIDPQAVEAAKLSLSLQRLSENGGEVGATSGVPASARPASNRRHGGQSAVESAVHSHRKHLPDLSSNIQCGNALIGPDFHTLWPRRKPHQRLTPPIHPFDWEAQFPEIMDAGGFDLVITNPPYLSFSGRQAAALAPEVRAYLSRRFTTDGWLSAHGLFIERCVRDLSRRMTAMIVPDQLAHLHGYAPVRRILTQAGSLVEVRYWGERVFEKVTTPALTFIADRKTRGPTMLYQQDGGRITLRLHDTAPWTGPAPGRLMPKLRSKSHSLDKLVADPGVHTGNCAKRLLRPPSGTGAWPVTRCAPVLEGKQVSRYRCDPPARLLRIDYQAGENEYFTIRPKATYTAARFVIRQTASRPIVGPRRGAKYFRNSLLALYDPEDATDVRYLAGLLNSRLMGYVYHHMVQESRQRTFPQVKVRALRELPIRAINFADPTDKSRHDQLVTLVDRMLGLQERAGGAKDDHERQSLERQSAETDARIDALVYRLYELNEDEVERVAEATSK